MQKLEFLKLVISLFHYFDAKIEISGTKWVEKTPIYIFSTFGLKINEFEQKKFQKPKSWRQSPKHLIHTSFSSFMHEKSKYPTLELLIFASYWGSLLVQFSKLNDFLWVCWFLCKIFSNLVYPIWKLHKPYCNNFLSVLYGIVHFFVPPRRMQQLCAPLAASCSLAEQVYQ